MLLKVQSYILCISANVYRTLRHQYTDRQSNLSTDKNRNISTRQVFAQLQAGNNNKNERRVAIRVIDQQLTQVG